MKVSELKGMRSDELGKKLDDLHKQIFTLRSQAVTENLENCRAIRNTRKDIARVMTVINQTELADKKGK